LSVVMRTVLVFMRKSEFLGGGVGGLNLTILSSLTNLPFFLRRVLFQH
jgi:hypothetical protein